MICRWTSNDPCFPANESWFRLQPVHAQGSDRDYELETLLSLDGQQFNFAHGYVVKLQARRVGSTRGQPHGVKYSLTLHDPQGRRIYGIDNTHQSGLRPEFDHRHVHGAGRIVRYEYRGAAALLDDFYREVERILRERGIG